MVLCCAWRWASRSLTADMRDSCSSSARVIQSLKLFLLSSYCCSLSWQRACSFSCLYRFVTWRINSWFSYCKPVILSCNLAESKEPLVQLPLHYWFICCLLPWEVYPLFFIARPKTNRLPPNFVISLRLVSRVDKCTFSSSCWCWMFFERASLLLPSASLPNWLTVKSRLLPPIFL